MSWTNVSHTDLRKFLFLISRSPGFLEELLRQRPRLTHAAAGLSVFFGDGSHARQRYPSPCTYTHTVSGCVRSAVTNADFPVSVLTQNVCVPLFWEAPYPVQSFCVRPAFLFCALPLPKMNGQIGNCCSGLNIWVSSNTEGALECLGFNSQNVLIISMLDMSYKHSRRDFWCLVILLKANLRTRGCSFESILGNYKENLSSPASDSFFELGNCVTAAKSS